MKEKIPTLLLLCLLAKVLIIIGLILFSGIGLGPDEAQYWTWSQALDWGYYSKPPGIAWQIWLGTQGFGQTELGVRALSLVLAFCQALAVYDLACRCGLQRATACWCGLLMALTPLGILGSFLAITDGGFLLFWTLACSATVAALHQKQVADPRVVGFYLLLGALFKWPIYLFWIFFFLAQRLYFPQSSLLKMGQGIGISLLGLLPSLVWNRSHEWATFRHVLATLQGGHSHTSQSGNLLEFMGAQMLLLSPILFLLLLAAGWRGVKHYRALDPALVFCGFVSFSSLAFMGVLALFQKMQGNWGIFAYPTGFVLMGWYACEACPKKRGWLKMGTGLSLALIGVLLTLHLYLPFKLNPFKHNMGWPRLRAELIKQGYDSSQHFLMSDKYQTVSLLSFYGPAQKRAYFLNLNGARKNQFSYWPSLQEEQKGKIGYFVWTENSPPMQNAIASTIEEYANKLKTHFDRIEYLGFFPLVYQRGEVVKGAFIFKCEECLAVQPEETFNY